MNLILILLILNPLTSIPKVRQQLNPKGIKLVREIKQAVLDHLEIGVRYSSYSLGMRS
jgi:hypothetical protein